MATTQKTKLSASVLKATLWETLQAVQRGEMEPGQADSVASQAREILRTTSVQLKVSSQSSRPVPKDVLAFSEGT